MEHMEPKKPDVVQGELFPKEETQAEKKAGKKQEAEKDPNIINPDSILAKLTPEEIEELDAKDEYYKGQD